MTNLEYKGMKSTRFRMAMLFEVVATAFFVSGMISADQWIDVTKWSLLAYAGSEVGAKYSEAKKSD